MHQHMLFEDKGGQPRARSVRGQGGEVRIADGATFFTLDQAVDHFKLPRAELIDLWDDAFADLPWATSPVASVAADHSGAANGSEASETTTAPRDDRPLATLRRVVGGNLADDEWDYYIELCRRRGFDPWCRQVIPTRETDARTGETRISIITTIGALVLNAQRSREYEGMTAPQWCGPDLAWKDGWPDDVTPFMARVGVFRRGFREPVWGVVHWKDRAPYWPVPDPAAPNGLRIELDPFWRDQGRHMLAKCARADALRNAFAEELGGVHTFDEMARADAQRRATGAMPVQSTVQSADADLIEIPAGRPEQTLERLPGFDADAIPNSDEEFDAALRALGGFDSPEVRRRVIRRFHVDLEKLFDINPQSAYAKAMDRVRQNPTAYGAVLGRRPAYSSN